MANADDSSKQVTLQRQQEQKEMKALVNICKKLTTSRCRLKKRLNRADRIMRKQVGRILLTQDMPCTHSHLHSNNAECLQSERATKEHATAILALETQLSEQRVINEQQEHQLQVINAKCAAMDAHNSTVLEKLQQQREALKRQLTNERASNSRYVNEILAYKHKYEQLCAEKETFDQRLDAVEMKRIEQINEVG
jgi:hypothetical protein